MGNIILIALAAFMIFMIVYGMRKGLARMLLSLMSIIIILVIVYAINPPVKQALMNFEPLHTSVYNKVYKYVEKNVGKASKTTLDTGDKAKENIIDNLSLPSSIKDSLKEKENQKEFEVMKQSELKKTVAKEQDQFCDYIATSLTNMIMGALAFVLSFVIVTILVKVLGLVLDVVTKLPVIKTMNSLGGATVGLAESIILIWIFMIVMTVLSTTAFGAAIMKGISENSVLSYMYDHNIIQQWITGIFNF